jgi:monovalent cation:H+ antiporter-2, CPA2 family
MHDLAPLIKDLAIMLSIAGVVVLLFQKIRQPVILGYIIAGVIIGPYTPPYSLVTDVTQIQTLSELGVIFLMFALGLDFSFHKLKRVGFSATITGIIKVSAIVVLGLFIGWFLNWKFYDRVFLGVAIAISSTMVIIKALEELNLKGKRFTDIVMGILIVEDLLAIIMLTTLSTVGITQNIFSLDMAWAVAKLLLVVGSWFLCGYFVVPILFRRIIKYVNQETLTVVSVGLCLALAVIAVSFHYSAALGAFIMGSILAETPLDRRIKQLTTPLRDVFAAVFFISVGMLIDINALIGQWQIVLAISALTIVGKVIATTAGTFLTGQSVNTSVRVGFSMAPIGEFSFIIISAGLMLNITSSSLYQIVIGVAAITTLATPYLIKLSNKITKQLDKNLSERSKYFLESYSAWVYRAIAGYKKHLGYRRFALQLIINGIIVAVIFTLSYDFILPQISRFTPNINVVRISSWSIALLFAIPFIWGMFFSFKVIDRNRQIPPLFLGWIVTIVEIIVLSVAYFSTWYIPLIIAAIVAVFFGLLYKQLGQSYHWFESHLAHILRRRNQGQNKYEELAPWDTHLVEIVVTNVLSSVVDKTFSENQLRLKFGVNVVAIRRGPKVILTPRGNEKILLQDSLIVLGNDEQIDSFKEDVEDASFETKHVDILQDFVLKAIVLGEEDSIVGQSIRDSHIREQISGLVVGLERGGFRILNPDPATILKSNDLLLIVGKAEEVFGLRKTEQKQFGL